MCKSEITNGCEHPERLKGKPEECSPEQITECHGDVKEHPCVKEKWSSQQIWRGQQNEVSYRNNSSSCGFVVSVRDNTNVAARQVPP